MRIWVLSWRPFFTLCSAVSTSENVSNHNPKKASPYTSERIFLFRFRTLLHCWIHLSPLKYYLGYKYSSGGLSHQLPCVTGLGVHPSHRASLHAPENSRLLWFPSHLAETGMSLENRCMSRWILMANWPAQPVSCWVSALQHCWVPNGVLHVWGFPAC